MRILLAAVLALAVCVTPSAFAQQAQPLWRRDATHLAADRAVALACLSAGGDCSNAVQHQCAPGGGVRSAAEGRMCDWRAIAAWEDEIEALLARLRAALSREDAAKLDESQRLWNASMLADVGLAMDVYAGGSLAGPVGAHVRALALVQRAQYLEEYRRLREQQ